MGGIRMEVYVEIPCMLRLIARSSVRDDQVLLDQRCRAHVALERRRAVRESIANIFCWRRAQHRKANAAILRGPGGGAAFTYGGRIVLLCG
jgi:hypothetical protein